MGRDCHAVINLAHTSGSEQLQYLPLPGTRVCILHHYRRRWKFPTISRLVRDLPFDTDSLRQLLLRSRCEIAVFRAGAQLEAKVYDHQKGETQHSEHSPLFDACQHELCLQAKRFGAVRYLRCPSRIVVRPHWGTGMAH